LFRMAGIQGELDKPQKSLGKNRLHNAHFKEGPAGRISGVELDIVLKCSNDANIPRYIKRAVKNWRGHVCSAQVHSAPGTWVYTETWDVMHHAFMKTYGVKVLVRTAGEASVIHIPNIIQLFVEAAVLLQIPSKICFLLAFWCLGLLSEVYREVLAQKFDIGQHFAHVMVRMMSNRLVYSKLMDQNEGISVARVSKVIRATAEEFQVESRSMSKFIRCCVEVIMDMQGNKYTNYSKRRSVAQGLIGS